MRLRVGGVQCIASWLQAAKFAPQTWQVRARVAALSGVGEERLLLRGFVKGARRYWALEDGCTLGDYMMVPAGECACWARVMPAQPPPLPGASARRTAVARLAAPEKLRDFMDGLPSPEKAEDEAVQEDEGDEASASIPAPALATSLAAEARVPAPALDPLPAQPLTQAAVEPRHTLSHNGGTLVAVSSVCLSTSSNFFHGRSR
eukprot:SAG11_NODE_11_length_27870_cov_16.327428_9_plen_204_part_00